MHTIPDLREPHRYAVRASIALVAQITAGDLGRATPCVEWNLGDLLAHMTVQHDGFAAAAHGTSTEIEAWRPRPVGDDFAQVYARAAERVIAAFAAPDLFDREFLLPEVNESRPIPARQAVSFHFIDYVVHGWDVARALGVPFTLPSDVLLAALPVAEAVPNGEQRRKPGAAFASRRPVPAGSDPLDRILMLLGRSPSWPDRVSDSH
jgi:uncharacterized protein (TIGR03086 family)